MWLSDEVLFLAAGHHRARRAERFAERAEGDFFGLLEHWWWTKKCSGGQSSASGKRSIEMDWLGGRLVPMANLNERRGCCHVRAGRVVGARAVVIAVDGPNHSRSDYL